MFTASHNPAQYNGIKLCRAYAAPVGQESGLGQIRDALAAGVTPPGLARGPSGSDRVSRDMLADYVAHLHSLVDLSAVRPMTVVVDAGNGMAGLTAPAVFAGLPLTLVPLYFELDGTFPNHEANPIDPANLRDLQAAVIEHGADIGLAFDGDADRCFVVDERGEIVSPSVLAALIADRELARDPGGTVIYNLITSRVVPEVVAEAGGTAVRTRVGHSFIKGVMAETGAVFGGEHSGHFYFRDFWRADSGMLAGLHALAALGEFSGPLSHLLAPYDRYAASGEINSTVTDQAEVVAALKRTWGDRAGVTIDELDGLTVTGRHVVVQRASQQHRAAAAAQRRGAGHRDDGDGARRGARPDPGRRAMSEPPIAPELLEIIVCPACHGELRPTPDAEHPTALHCTERVLRAPVPGAGRDPGPARRRGGP